jgi:hypothetical protein
MEHKYLLPYSQKPASGPYPEPHASSPHFPHYFSKIHSKIIFQTTPMSSKWCLLFMFLQ